MNYRLIILFALFSTTLFSSALGQESTATKKAQASSEKTDSMPAPAEAKKLVQDTSQLRSGSTDNKPVSEIDPLCQLKVKQLKEKLDSIRKANSELAGLAAERLSIEMNTGSFRDYKFHTCYVNPKKIRIQLFNSIEGKKGKNFHTFKTVEDLAQREGKTLIFAMNGGMFERSRRAKGLFIVKGKEEQAIDMKTEGYGNFYMQPNGIFAVDTNQNAYVIPTQEFPALQDSLAIQFATQSGPMMLIDGQINGLFNDGSPNRYIRNAVGVTARNEVVFAISEEPVTFFELSSFLLKQGCTNALYLDGAISKAFFANLENGSNIEEGNSLGPIIAIMK
jgi:uncharacterized protein YigE (DUF2233 family)